MHRRDVFKLIVALFSFSSGGFQTRRRLNTVSERTFFVAGARFYKRAFEASTGDPVRIKPASFGKELCLEVLTMRNERIGYVPRSLVSVLSECQIVESYLSSFNKHAVPWKRYEVTVKANG